MMGISIQFVVIGQNHPSQTTSRHALTADQSDTKLSHGQVNPNAETIALISNMKMICIH